MEQFLTENALYVVLVVTMITWIGIGIYLNRLEQKLSTLENRINKQ